MRALSVRALGLALALSFTGAVADPTLFLADSTFDESLTRIFSVEPTSGEMTLRADLGTDWTPVLAMAAANASTLYVVGSDTTAESRCGTARSCLLLRVVLDPASRTPLLVTPIGPVTAAGQTVVEIVGLTFDRRGRLWATSQQDGGLYEVDPETAHAERVGTISVEVHGGDISFDDQDNLWMWTNIGAQSGRYALDPISAAAASAEIHDGLDFAGMAALGHGPVLYGASATMDQLDQIDAVSGLSGPGPQLKLDGVAFNHSRGDLDSPWCEEDAACSDADACTVDRCSPGGCAFEHLPFVDTDGDGRENCIDACAATTRGQRVDARGCSVADRCPCAGPWEGHGAYVSCVDAAAHEIYPSQAGRIIRAASRSACGKRGSRR